MKILLHLSPANSAQSICVCTIFLSSKERLLQMCVPCRLALLKRTSAHSMEPLSEGILCSTSENAEYGEVFVICCECFVLPMCCRELLAVSCENTRLGFKMSGHVTNANYSVKKLQFTLFINRELLRLCHLHF